MNAADALKSIPSGLRDPLLNEYREITKNFAERRWKPSELSGGHFCEIVFTILEGYSGGKYASKPAKPRDFLSACRALESNSQVPRSFQILIPRILPALYEVRNHRGVGHAGGDVDPNHMDATAVLSMCNWIMAELVRVFHQLSTDDAQAVVDSLAERAMPLVWQRGDMKRVLDPNMKLPDQIMLLIASVPGSVEVGDLFTWCDYDNKAYFMKILRDLHARRMVELHTGETLVEVLPPGSKHMAEFIASHQQA